MAVLIKTLFKLYLKMMVKNIIWKSDDLAAALAAEIPQNLETGILQFNSRDVNEGDLFIALGEGERDGHKYVQDALDKGASAAIICKDVDASIPRDKLIKVQDTAEALRSLADYKRLNSRAKFIAITGSVGKTSTKEAMSLVLSEFGKCFAGRGNFNNHLGVPINLASMPDDIDYAVLELGMSAKGEIEALAAQVLPHFAIITSIAENHLEFFDSVKQIAKAKCEILNGLDLNDGVAILPRDADTYDVCVSCVDRQGLQNVRTFGKNQDANIRFVSYEVMEDNMVRLGYKIYNNKVEFVMNFIPEHIAANFASCFAVSNYLGLKSLRVTKALSKLMLDIGRGRIVETSKSGKNFTIITDYYNSSPTSLKASLQNISLLDAPSKVLIIGDMGELGKDAAKFHADIAEHIISSGVTRVFLIGILVKEIAKKLDNTEVKYALYETAENFLQDADKNLAGGEMILIKGSRFMHLEKIAHYLGVEDDL